MKRKHLLNSKSVKFKFLTKGCFTFLIGFLMSFSVSAQTKEVTGTVIDKDSNLPIPGVAVIVKGTNKGTQTDFDGKYSISVSSNEANLEFSYIGYKTETIAVGDKKIIDVTMIVELSELDEVVVIGYGTVKKSDLTGAVSKVSEKDFNQGIVSSPDQLIQGRAAGVQVISSSGQPGAANTVRIRGNSSIRAGNDPLYVVDGIQIAAVSGKPGASNTGISSSPSSNPLNFLNPGDIESIEILKDASATAIFGSRGANGVIIITTKKGKNGVPTIEFNSSVGLSSLLNEPDNLTASEYRQALIDYDRPGGDFGGNVNAFDEITRDHAITNNHSISIGSATESAKYRVSLGYFDQEGIIQKSNLKRVNANINGSFKFLESKKLGLDVNLIVSNVNETTPPIGTSSGAGGSLISAALAWNPTQPFYNDDGSIFQLGGASLSSPVALLAGFSDTSEQTNIISNISPSYKITDDLIYKMSLAYDKTSGSRRGYGQPWVQSGGVLNRGFAYINTLNQTRSILSHTLNYNKDISEDFSLSLLAGYEWQRNTFEATNANAQDFPEEVAFSDLTLYFPLTSPFTQRNIASFKSPIGNLQSYFGRANFNYKDLYLLTATFRADGANQFGANNKYGYFPSLAFAWNLNNEKFMEDSVFSNLKLRLSWGQVGNQNIGGAAFFAASFTQPDLLGQIGIQTVNGGNPNLRWETTTSTNIGLDFGILNNRITGSLEYFNNDTTDLLFSRLTTFPGPRDVRGVSNIDANLINRGFEITLNANVINTEKFSWDIGANASFITNEVKNLEEVIDYGQLFGQGISGVTAQRLQEGQPINSFYLPVYLGTDENGVDLFKTETDADGNVTEVKEFVGDANPDVILGINTSFSYNKWTANLNFNGTFGNQILYNTGMATTNVSNIGSLNIAESQNGFNVVNVPKASTKYLFDGDYLRLSNATISYNVGDYMAFKNISVFFTGTNIFTITNYPGSDPETNIVNNLDGLPSSGIDYEAYPNVRSFLIGTRFSL